MPKKIEVVKDPENEVPFEVFEEEILSISSAMRRLERTRLTERMIVTLIQDDVKLGKGTIEAVLRSWRNLEQTYLKPRKNK